MREDFEKYIIAKYPSRSSKILFQLKRVTHSDYVYEVQEVRELWELWQSRQTVIDELQERVEEATKLLGKLELNTSNRAISILRGEQPYQNKF